MTRAKRCHVPGAVYWVDVEGIAEIQAFPDESDYLAYIKDVMAYAVKYDAKVLAYLIESNRAQLLIMISDEPLSKLMQCIQQAYSRCYNKRFNRKGSVFNTRYHSFIVNPEMLKEAVLCMAQLPLIQQFGNVMDYQGSFFAHLDEKSSLAVDYYLDSELSSFQMKVDALYKEIIENIHSIEKMELKWHESEPRNKLCSKFIDIVDFYVVGEEVDLQLLRTNTKQKPYSDIRKAIILIAHSETDKTQSFIADYFNISEPTVSKIVHGDYVSNQFVKTLLELWKRRIINDNLAKKMERESQQN